LNLFLRGIKMILLLCKYSARTSQRRRKDNSMSLGVRVGGKKGVPEIL
jgi:hypothetical protein